MENETLGGTAASLAFQTHDSSQQNDVDGPDDINR